MSMTEHAKAYGHDLDRNQIVQVPVSYTKRVSVLSKSTEMPLMVLASRYRVNSSWSARHRVGWG